MTKDRYSLLHAARINWDRLALDYEQQERKQDLGENDRKTLRDIGVLQKQVSHYQQIANDKQERLKARTIII